MAILTQVAPDVNDDEILWLEFVMFVPAIFPHLLARHIEPEVAIDLIADDGLRVCDDPPKIADDGDEVREWRGMYEAVA